MESITISEGFILAIVLQKKQIMYIRDRINIHITYSDINLIGSGACILRIKHSFYKSTY